MLGIFAPLGLVLTFFGFGVALALHTRFGTDILEVLRGPSDYLAASSVVVVSAFNMIFRKLYGSAGLAELLLFGVVVCCVVAAIFSIGALVWANRRRQLIVRTFEVVREAPVVLRHRLSMHPWAWRPAAVVGGSVVVGALPYLLGYAMMFVLTVAVVPFWLGLQLSDLHFYETVVEPYYCAPLVPAANQRAIARRTPEERREASEWREPREPYLAVCVEVKLDKLGTYRGRRVIATGDTIVLYDPATGRVSVLPKKDAVVSMIDKL
jgi:hypothetical protein